MTGLTWGKAAFTADSSRVCIKAAAGATHLGRTSEAYILGDSGGLLPYAPDSCCHTDARGPFFLPAWKLCSCLCTVTTSPLLRMLLLLPPDETFLSPSHIHFLLRPAQGPRACTQLCPQLPYPFLLVPLLLQSPSPLSSWAKLLCI